MEKAKIEELLKKHNLEGKFTWTPGTVISDLVKEYLPTLKIPFNCRARLSKTLTVSQFVEKINELCNVVNFFDDIDSIKRQSLEDRGAIEILVFRYWSIGRILNSELGENVIPRQCVKLPNKRQ